MNPIAVQLRSKKLGVLIRDARLAAHRSVEECADKLGIDAEVFSAYEYGEASPSLPELEVLSYYLNVPLDHFWGDTAISEKPSEDGQPDFNQILELRRRIVGARLREVRSEQNLELEAVASEVGVAAQDLEAYELGEKDLPLPVLETICMTLGIPVGDLFDQHGPLGVWARQQQGIQMFLGLPDDLQDFVVRPVNRPYLELAIRLSEMSAEKLRAIGEGILEITL